MLIIEGRHRYPRTHTQAVIEERGDRDTRKRCPSSSPLERGPVVGWEENSIDIRIITMAPTATHQHRCPRHAPLTPSHTHPQ